jgi:hypothetical protein
MIIPTIMPQEQFVEDFADNLGLSPTDELDENAFATLLSVGFERSCDGVPMLRNGENA